MSAKKIIAMFAVVGAQEAAQESAAPDGRIFSDDFNGVNVNDFLYNSDSSYIYENLDANYGANYANYGDYDGTANQPAAESAGRPNAGNDGADEKSQNVDSIDVEGKAEGHNVCRVCTGQTAGDCQTANLQETCNDAQDACAVQVRSEYVGSTIVHKFWSGCDSKFACEERRSKNFYSTDATDAMRNQCRGENLNRRNYSPSQCTLCSRLGDSAVAETLLFSNGDDLNVQEDGNNPLSWTAILNDPVQNLPDLYALQTDFYTINA